MTDSSATTAAIYARLSQDKKKGTADEGLSIAEQIQACQDYIERQGWTLGTVYEDNDLSSEKVKFRPGFEQMLDDKPNLVIVWNQDRLERGYHDALFRFFFAGLSGFESNGTPISAETASGEFVAGMKSLQGKYEGRLRRERQKLANLRDAKAGKWHYSRPVFGNDYKTGALVPDEAEAIRKAAKAYKAGDKSFYQIAKDWNAQGFRTPRSENVGGKEWEVGTVRIFFTSERLIGKRTYEGTTRVMVGWEPVLDEDTFGDVQTLINAGRTGKRGVSIESRVMHLLTGICRCGQISPETGAVCGKGMNIGYRGDKDSARYYNCTTPTHLTRTAEPLERYVVELFLYLLASPGAEDLVSPDSAKNEVGALRTEKARLTTDYAAWLEDAIEADLSVKLMKAKEVKHEERLAEIEARLMEYNRRNLFDGLIFDYAEAGAEGAWKRWNVIPRARQRKVIEALIAKVEVQKAPQGTRFSPKYVKISGTPLLMKLIDATEESTMVLTQEQYKAMTVTKTV